MVEGEDKEVVLITLKRPLIYIQPMAVDKAILVWLNYKNAYEYWNEQRSNLNKEVLTATHQVLEKVPFGQLTSSPHLGTLFLQLTVDDMGICLPLNPLPLVRMLLFRIKHFYRVPFNRIFFLVVELLGHEQEHLLRFGIQRSCRSNARVNEYLCMQLGIAC